MWIYLLNKLNIRSSNVRLVTDFNDFADLREFLSLATASFLVLFFTFLCFVFHRRNRVA